MGDSTAHLVLAKILFDNHWLSHARRACLDAAETGDEESDGALRSLQADIERRLTEPDALDLSRHHAPMIVSQASGTIVSTLHFRRQHDDFLKREAFKQAVSYIDVETSSQCNRRCGYCPNAENDRLSSNSFMDDAVFVPFVNNLRAIDYARDVHFVGFNEPLMHKENLLSRLALTRRLLPRASITVYTNGDYLTAEVLHQLIAAGMSGMIISVHLAPDKPYHEGEIFERINRVAQRLGTPITPLSYMKDTYITAQLVHPGANITIRQLDYMRWGSNRASVLGHIGPQIEARTSACVLPINQFILRYDGFVDPCCTIFSDTPSTRRYSVGNVAGASSIFDIYCGEALVGWRRSLFHIGPKQTPCDKCADNCAQPMLNDNALYEPWRHFVSLTPVSPALVA